MIVREFRTWRWLLIIGLTAILLLDLMYGYQLSSYQEQGTAKYATKKSEGQTAVKGPFLLSAENGASWFWSFAERNANAINALSTFAVAILTVPLMLIGYAQWRSMQDAFYASHRPKLVVRRAMILADPNEPPVRIAYVITNVGDSVAYIETSDVQGDLLDQNGRARRRPNTTSRPPTICLEIQRST
jgi:hypothetical protein